MVSIVTSCAQSNQKILREEKEMEFFALCHSLYKQDIKSGVPILWLMAAVCWLSRSHIHDAF